MMPLSDLFAAFRWWTVVTTLGLVATPITFRIFSQLPGRGYAFAKLVGLLLGGYFFWILASLGFVRNTLGGILIALLILLILSYTTIQKSPQHGEARPTIVARGLKWLRENWRYILIVELLFAFLFFLWVFARSQNPAILGTEKPMEFAFLNSASDSPSYPPLDPWLSGFAISYYYFGYVLTSVLTRLAFVKAAVGFNLAIAWLLAASGVAAFGLVFNLLRVKADAARKLALTLGLVAAIALPLAGNTEIILELFHANGVGSDRFWEWLDIRDLEPPAIDADMPRYDTPDWWWWRSSRVIHEYHLSGRPEENLEPIAEFPSFSFVLGDLHPHVLALPYAFLSLATALLWWLRTTPLIPLEELRLDFDLPRRVISGINSNTRYQLFFTGLLLGGLTFLNTWDVLIHLFIIVGAFVLGRWRNEGRWSNHFLRESLLVTVMLIVPAILLYLPFYLGFRSQAGAPFILPMMMRPTRLAHYLVIFGFPLSVIIVFVLSTFELGDLAREKGRRNLRKAVLLALGLVGGLLFLQFIMIFIVAANPFSWSTIQNLATENNITLPTPLPDWPLLERVGWAFTVLRGVVPLSLNIRLKYPSLAVFLLLLCAAALHLLISRVAPGSADRQSQKLKVSDSSIPFVLLLVLTGILLSLGPEFVYLKDNFGQRINTIFKFYYQTWVMFGVAAIASLGYMVSRKPVLGSLVASGYIVGLSAVLLFPILAISSRALEFQGPPDSPTHISPTLDGLAHFRVRQPDEYEAITWLKDNYQDTPTVIEAVGGSYTGFGRVASITGFPTILGWPGHEYQWRGNTVEPAIREGDVESFYKARDRASATEILDKYGVGPIYYGNLESNLYGLSSKEFLDDNFTEVFSNGTVSVYRWK